MNMRLLIVDDDLPFRERLTRSMEKKGFEVVSSPGFKDSLLKVTEKNFDYAVVDKQLRVGGLAFAIIGFIIIWYLKT